ncbi:amidophosphoribosyltransferase [Bacteroides pyogenes JCM 10003]|nr:amidophosphoribosyltransferase [Bacteroides pyogenes JCM 10003]
MEQLKHECGVAMIRLLKPLEYYEEKYGTWMYGLNKLYLLMEKQHNRGQEGAGLACVKMQSDPGEEYMFRERALGSGAITEIFQNVQANFKDLTPEQLHDPEFAKRTLPFAGEAYMGHLRYSTTGKSGIAYVHPFLRRNNWRAKNLALCGNFNLTNLDEIFARITAIGQHPRQYADTYIMLEQVGHRLDREVERVFNLAEAEALPAWTSHTTSKSISTLPTCSVPPPESGTVDMLFAALPEVANLSLSAILGAFVPLSGIKTTR